MPGWGPPWLPRVVWSPAPLNAPQKKHLWVRSPLRSSWGLSLQVSPNPFAFMMYIYIYVWFSIYILCYVMMQRYCNMDISAYHIIVLCGWLHGFRPWRVEVAAFTTVSLTHLDTVKPFGPCQSQQFQQQKSAAKCSQQKPKLRRSWTPKHHRTPWVWNGILDQAKHGHGHSRPTCVRHAQGVWTNTSFHLGIETISSKPPKP